MKRHPSLEPFSRDHNIGLILARRLVQAAREGETARQDAASSLLKYWADELEDHFAEEERTLLPLIPSDELRERLLREHRSFAEDIRALSDGSSEPRVLLHAGETLNDHIRWEERVLFPAIEASATKEQMHALEEQTSQVEARRSDSSWSPRRGELMRRRKNRTP